jgi:hypothetical protein
MEFKKTERGFAISEFIDYYGSKCSIQKSSLAFTNAIWLGVDEVHPKIMTSEGWIDYDIPKEVLLSSRMHLTQDMVKELLPILQSFAETGELDSNDCKKCNKCKRCKKPIKLILTKYNV